MLPIAPSPKAKTENHALSRWREKKSGEVYSTHGSTGAAGGIGKSPGDGKGCFDRYTGYAPPRSSHLSILSAKVMRCKPICRQKKRFRSAPNATAFRFAFFVIPPPFFARTE